MGSKDKSEQQNQRHPVLCFWCRAFSSQRQRARPLHPIETRRLSVQKNRKFVRYPGCSHVPSPAFQVCTRGVSGPERESLMQVILQSESSECGLACLAMLANYHGYHSDLADLRRRFSISLKGATLAQIARHASAMQLSTRPLRLNLDELAQLNLPCILHWRLNHFVVLKKVQRNRRGRLSCR